MLKGFKALVCTSSHKLEGKHFHCNSKSITSGKALEQALSFLSINCSIYRSRYENCRNRLMDHLMHSEVSDEVRSIRRDVVKVDTYCISCSRIVLKLDEYIPARCQNESGHTGRITSIVVDVAVALYINCNFLMRALCLTGSLLDHLDSGRSLMLCIASECRIECPIWPVRYCMFGRAPLHFKNAPTSTFAVRQIFWLKENHL